MVCICGFGWTVVARLCRLRYVFQVLVNPHPRCLSLLVTYLLAPARLLICLCTTRLLPSDIQQRTTRWVQAPACAHSSLIAGACERCGEHQRRCAPLAAAFTTLPRTETKATSSSTTYSRSLTAGARQQPRRGNEPTGGLSVRRRASRVGRWSASRGRDEG